MQEIVISKERIQCILCSDVASTICWFPAGCTCLDNNEFQPRCAQHTRRADDYHEVFYIVETFWPEEFRSISLEKAVEYFK